MVWKVFEPDTRRPTVAKAAPQRTRAQELADEIAAMGLNGP